jgi:putative ATP-dependent endonuclease of OLD family
LGSKVKLDNLIICHSNSAYPLGKKHTKLEDDDYLFLERFLDATKANLFFAKGVIFVEGWSEEILLPAFVKKLKQQDILSKNLTEAGISIVNVGSTAFLRYSRIFLRKNKENKINIPVSIITDVDIKTYAKTEQLDVNGKIIKKGKNTVYDYTPIDVTEVAKDSVDAKVALEKKYDKQNVKAFVAPSWTLEYSLFKSASLLPIFSKAIKKVHPQIDQKHLERELAKKLINKGLDKTELAYELAQELEKDSNSKNPKIDIDITDSHISYLIDAIKYACND